MAQKCKNLRKLYIDMDCSRNDGVPSIKLPATLKSLTIIFSYNYIDLSFLSNLPLLESLTLEDIDNISDDIIFRIVANCPLLRSLNLGDGKSLKNVEELIFILFIKVYISHYVIKKTYTMCMKQL